MKTPHRKVGVFETRQVFYKILKSKQKGISSPSAQIMVSKYNLVMIGIKSLEKWPVLDLVRKWGESDTSHPIGVKEAPTGLQWNCKGLKHQMHLKSMNS